MDEVEAVSVGLTLIDAQTAALTFSLTGGRRVVVSLRVQSLQSLRRQINELLPAKR
jgi:hypothetical protein